MWGNDAQGINVLVADDQPLMRRALMMFVNAAPGMQTVGEACDGQAAVQQCAALSPDVVLIDMQMPVMNGVEATGHIVKAHPEVRVIAVTTFSSELYLVPALRAGASGYLLKDAEPEQIVTAIRQVHGGGSVLSALVTQQLISSIRQTPAPRVGSADDSVEPLSEREEMVVCLLGRGMSNAEIAAGLHLSEATVKTHMGRIMAKWKVRDRVQVVIKAARAGLICID
ncbi:response regulator transcription factor [Arthrobacter sp. H35-D1]|uniref:response regulator n=1 Tax=Arthrobacter sp. H35-D1 TaxID=3046202 RepID=UPI0024B9E4F4|nr:response regulator transcription factor [Arthrobacter sp. H35-D1]MDJ0312181.1 response regulator transcription factor [Arthrobacter sp. H35-D1]